MMKKLVFLMTVLLLAGSVFGQASIPYSTSFEALEGFTAGQSINGVDGWAVISEGDPDALISDAAAQSGSQSVALEANSTIDKPLTSTASAIWMEGYFRGEGTTAEPSFPAAPLASAIVFFSQSNGIQCLNGDGTGGVVSWENTSVASLNPAEWYKITIRQDYTAKTWRCWINNSATPDMDLGFRDSIDSLNGFRNYADTASWLDTFRVIPAIGGDANADGIADVSDVITLVNDPDGAGLGVIGFNNADMDGNDTVDSTDLADIVDKILARS